MAHLVFQTAFPGDLFLSIPLLKQIRVWDPETDIVLACRPGLGEWFKKNNLVDEVLEIDKKSGEGRARSLQRLRSTVWDTVFVPHESPRTQLWMARVKARQAKVSFHKWWNFWIYNKRVVKPMALPDALRQLSLLAAVSPAMAEKFAEPALEIRLDGKFDTSDSLSVVQALASPLSQSSPLKLDRPLIPDWASMKVLENRPVGNKIFLAPGSVWATKRWTANGYADLAALLLRRRLDVELVGSPQERELCEQVVALAQRLLKTLDGQPALGRLSNSAGETSLGGLVDLLSTGRALVANDSGAMHAAAAADLPTVAIFGPTTLELGFRPWQNRAVVVQRELECRPCGKHGATECPIRTHACMEKISASDVFSALKQFLPVSEFIKFK